jgi:hypothetical protein
MKLFDIGALVYFIGFFNMICFLIKGNRGATKVCILLEALGGAIMWIAYYIVAGNDFTIF